MATTRQTGSGTLGRVFLALTGIIVAAIVCVIAGFTVLQSPSRPPPPTIAYIPPKIQITSTTKPAQRISLTSKLPQPTRKQSPRPATKTVLVAKKADIKPEAFYMLQDVRSGRWLARALDTNVEVSSPVEKIFKVYHADSSKYGKWFALKGHTRMHLTRELNDKVTVDRPWARGFEQWKFIETELPSDVTEGTEAKASFTAAGGKASDRTKVFLLKSMPRHENNENHVISQSKRDTMGLVATASSIKNPVYWRLYRVTSCSTEDECWGAEVEFGADARPDKPGEASLVLQRLARLGPFPIIGSPKPLSHAQLDVVPKDAFDAVRISSRTLMNWASLPGFASFQLTDDKNTQLVVDQINRMVEIRRTKTQSLCQVPVNITKRTVRFEMMSKFDNQPTYRGVFKRGFEEFPTARCAMFSNGDILYTPSLSQTLERVLKFLDDKAAALKRQGKPWHDKWMVVGQRTNFDVPASWTLMDSTTQCNMHGFPQWVGDIEKFASKGEKFQSNAEDYFIVSRNMFDWDAIPDFIVGGVAFDNWIVDKGNEMARQGEAVMIDATKTVTALHQNHHVDPKVSHGSPKSVYNSHLAHEHGGVGNDGHTADATVATERLADGSITVYDKHRLLFK